MYGVVVPYEKFKDSIVNTIDDDIQGIFSGRDGKFIILGKVLDANSGESFLGEIKPFEIHKLTMIDERIVESIVFDKYGVRGNFHYYLITK